MRRAADVIVIGGGVFGLAAAGELSRRGLVAAGCWSRTLLIIAGVIADRIDGVRTSRSWDSISYQALARQPAAILP